MLNTAVSAVVALPLLPLAVLGRTPVPSMNQVAAGQVGWPRYVEQVAGAVLLVAVCREPSVPWSELWERVRHLD